MLLEKEMKKIAQSYLTEELEKDLKRPLLLIEAETIEHSFFITPENI